ncbi:MAG: hypothetical protein JJU13_08335 [Balneolaceae bacterium]|nr:hypothetical protein [Balneolaceae bacterium]
MEIKALEKEAIREWGKYGSAINEAFNFKKGSLINTEAISEAVRNNDIQKLKQLIKYAKEQTILIKNLD